MSTFYLKYRPQRVGELDLKKVSSQLLNILKSDEMPHAFLFSGPRGLGKTSSARILAKAINCENDKEIEPCNECEACKRITAGSAVDVMEIDGASNRGIDDVRVLREGVMSAPVMLKKKIYVIDEVHMLTKEAFNALLKTLEEPPSHVVFMMATTEPEKVPETIISRAFHIEFQRASKDEIVGALKKVVRGEKLKIEEIVLEKIAAKSHGGFRDSIKMLEQLSFLDKKEIGLDDYREMFADVEVDSLITLLVDRDIKKCLDWVEKSEKQGVGWKDVVVVLLEKLQSEMLAYYEIGEGKYEFNQKDLERLIVLLMKAGMQVKYALLPVLPVQMAFIKYCDQPGKVAERSESGGGGDHKKNVSSSEDASVVEDKKPSREEKKQESTVKKERVEVNKKNAEKSAGKREAGLELKELKERWDEVLAVVKKQNYSVSALLKSTYPEEIQGDRVVVKVFYEFHKNQLGTEKNREVLMDGFEEIFGTRVKFEYILGDVKERDQQANQKDEQLVQAAEEIFG